jgi:hypothetical protein
MSKLPAALALLSLTPACAWNSEWTFAATKECYDGATHDGPSCPPSGWNQSGGKHEAAVLGVFILGLIVLPIAIDVACLPIEWTHDQLVCDY